MYTSVTDFAVCGPSNTVDPLGTIPDLRLATSMENERDHGAMSEEARLYDSKGMAAYRAPSLLQPHKARQAIADAHVGRIPPLLGVYLAWASPPVAKVVAQLGFDFVWVDWEHASMSVETMTQMVHDVQLVSEGRSAALVRVPGHDHAAIGYALDAGASIIVPQVDTVEQARHVVSAAKFGERVNGTRSAPPFRWMPGTPSMQSCNPSLSFWENLNEQAAIIFQIESRQGIENLDAILTAVGEHVDSVWLGSLDCRVSMGLVADFWGEEPEWTQLVSTFQTTLAKYNMPYSGLALGDVETLQERAAGRTLMFTSADALAILGMASERHNVRKMFPRKDLSTKKRLQADGGV